MAQIVWTEPALSDLDGIADHIGLENPVAAAELVRKVFHHVDMLAKHPRIGSKPPELKGWRYRQIIEPPCRIFYRQQGSVVLILHVMREEQQLRRGALSVRHRKVSAPRQ
ncbi:MAG: type II toxin-antitoxin system RelE/ParE family toxin [Candidatus Hydrogenedentota bacterium]